MDYLIDTLTDKIKKPFLYVDFNEGIETNLFLLSQIDIKNDLFGNPISLYKGLELIGYMKDEDMDGNRDDLYVEGVCIENKTGTWEYVKWLIKVNAKGIQYTSESKL